MYNYVDMTARCQGPYHLSVPCHLADGIEGRQGLLDLEPPQEYPQTALEPGQGATGEFSQGPMIRVGLCLSFCNYLPSNANLRVSKGLIPFSLLVSQIERRMQKAEEPPRARNPPITFNLTLAQYGFQTVEDGSLHEGSGATLSRV